MGIEYELIPQKNSTITLGGLEELYLQHFLLKGIDNEIDDYLFHPNGFTGKNKDAWKKVLLRDDSKYISLIFFEYTPIRISINQREDDLPELEILEYYASRGGSLQDKNFLTNLDESWKSVGFSILLEMHPLDIPKEARVFFTLVLTIAKLFNACIIPNTHENSLLDKNYIRGAGLYSIEEIESIIKPKFLDL